MITLIAAIDLNSALGYKNELLVKLPNDMKHFRKQTENTHCVFGRKTYESIGRPLPNRTNIILSKSAKYNPHPAVFVYNTVDEILWEYENYAEKGIQLNICGGSQIYKEFLPVSDRIILTIIHHEFSKTDAYFPNFSLEEWKVVSNEFHKADDNHPYDYSFVIYERKAKYSLSENK